MKRFYGWRVAWALAVTQVLGYGVLYYAFSVFLAPMEHELGWTRAQTSGAFSIALLLSGVVALPLGRLVDRRGARALMTIGSGFGALLVLLWSFVDSLLGLYLVQAGIGLAMAAVLYEVAFTVVAVWFRRDRTRAMLLITVVAGLASTIFIPLCSALVEGVSWRGGVLIDPVGWRGALRLLALLLAVTTVPLHALVLRRHPNDLGFEPDGGRPGETRVPPEPSISAREALREPTFWWLSLAFSLDRIVIVGMAAHGLPLLIERGFSPTLAAFAAGSIGLMQITGRLLFAPGSRRIPLAVLTPIVFGLHALSLLALLLLPGVAALWLFAVLFGAANGAGTLARAALVADTYGSGNFGSINGAMTTLIALVQTVAPLGAGLLHDLGGSYGPVLWALIAISLLAALAAMRARPPLPSAA